MSTPVESGKGSTSPRNPRAKKSRERSLFSQFVDTGLKIILGGVGLWVSYLGYSYQKTSTASQLMIQQEKGDIEIRAQMFTKITERLMRPNEQGNNLVQDALLTQVLALNFHELIELKPLMINLDRRMGEAINLLQVPSDPKQIRDKEELVNARRGLRRVAKRIRSRQVTALVNDQDQVASNYDQPFDSNYGGQVKYVSFVRNGIPETSNCKVRLPLGRSGAEFRRTGCMKEMIELPGFSEDEVIRVAVERADWGNETFTVSLNTGKKVKIELPPGVKPDEVKSQVGEACSDLETDQETSREGAAAEGYTSFQVSWYDFPYTDNTVRVDGERYSIFIDRICEKFQVNGGLESDVPNSVRLGLLYFPKDYYPARDRPARYNDLRKKLLWQ